jgi:hypothetical protein
VANLITGDRRSSRHKLSGILQWSKDIAIKDIAIKDIAINDRKSMR